MGTNVGQIQPVTRDNWEQALQISLHEHQTHLVPIHQPMGGLCSQLKILMER